MSVKKINIKLIKEAAAPEKNWKDLDPNNPADYDQIYNMVITRQDYLDGTSGEKQDLKNQAMRAHLLRKREEKPKSQITKPGKYSRKALYQPQRGKIEQDLYDTGKELGIGTHGIRKGAESIMKTMILILDPTGQVGDIDMKTGNVTPTHKLLKRQYDSFKQKPSILGAAGVALTSLAMIPIIGGLAKAGKLAVKGVNVATQTKKVVQNAQKIRKELYNLPAGQKTPEINRAIQQLDAKTILAQRLIPVTTKRTSTFIRNISSQVNKSVLRKFKAGDVTVGKTFDEARPVVFNVPRFNPKTGQKIEKLSDVEKIEVRFMTSNGPRVYSTGRYTFGDPGDPTKVLVMVHIPKNNFVRQTSTGKLILDTDPRIFKDIQDNMQQTLRHELTHGSQNIRAQKGKGSQEWAMPDRKGKYLKYNPNKDLGNKSYHAYRMQKIEIEPFAVQAAVSPRAVAKSGTDTLDRLSRNIHSSYDDLYDFFKAIIGPIRNVPDLSRFLKGDKSVKFNASNRYKSESAKIGFLRSKREFKLFAKEVRTAQAKRPCAAISAFNAFLLAGAGLYDLSGLKGKNRQIYDKVSLDYIQKNPDIARRTAVPINPKACPYKSLKEWQEAEDRKLL